MRKATRQDIIDALLSVEPYKPQHFKDYLDFVEEYFDGRVAVDRDDISDALVDLIHKSDKPYFVYCRFNDEYLCYLVR